MCAGTLSGQFRITMKIGLLDHMGYGNLGDAAIQDVVIDGIKKRLPDCQLIGFSLIPEDTEKRHGIPCYPVWWQHPQPERPSVQNASKARLKSILESSLKNIPFVYRCCKLLANVVREIRFSFQSYRVLRGLDVLIISGGGQLDDLWRGPWLQPYNLFKFSVLTKLARRKLYFLNVGAGPLKHPLSQFFARWAVMLADYRSFRDQDSRERIRKLGVKTDTQVYPDTAYGLQIGAINGHRNASRPLVGLNPTGFCDPRVWPLKSDAVYQEYVDKLVRFSLWLIGAGYSVKLFSTDLINDRLAIEDIKSNLTSTASSPDLLKHVTQTTTHTVKEVLLEMSNFDFVVTSKYHGIVFSHVLTKPVISLSYQRKMDVAMQAVGQGDFCADIEHFDVDWLIQAFRLLIVESKNIKSAFGAAVEAKAAALSQQFDTLFLPDRP